MAGKRNLARAFNMDRARPALTDVCIEFTCTSNMSNCLFIIFGSVEMSFD